MPYKFTFLVEGQLHFAAPLVCERCEGRTRTGTQCSRNTCIGTRWCFQHLATKKLRIQTSRLPHAGKGLFAVDKDLAVGETVFRRGDAIIAYDGDLVTREEIDARYGDYTAPYGIEISRTRFEDGALHRGVGTLANHPAAPYRSNAQFSVKQRRVVLVATRTIRNHDEIFVNYGRNYRFNEPTTFRTR
jgi:SET domain-containing protein